MTRAWNFGAGPAMLPQEVLQQAQQQLLDYQGSGMSILESSHRGKAYEAVHQEAQANLRELMAIPEDYAVLFLQGGATLQFAMVPMNLLGKNQVADYTHSGAWAAKAIDEAKRIGSVHLAADTSAVRPARVPLPAELALTPGAAYLHITSNETIAGTQWKTFPNTQEPLVADMSSDILSRPIDVKAFGLIYAGAQKNLGPAGVTVVIIRKDLAQRVGDSIAMFLRYATHIKENSLYNTPACFAVYLLMLFTRWLIKQGGVSAISKRNQEKASRLYAAIDGSSFYRGIAHTDHRSQMNVTFRLPTEELEAEFVREASACGLKGLQGHRSAGGIRASLYNAMPIEGVDALIEWMKDFEQRQGKVRFAGKSQEVA